MKYLEKYDCYIDSDCVVYRMAPVRGNHGNPPGKLYRVRTRIDRCGYIRLNLWKVPNPYLHQVVAYAFLGEPPFIGATVDHIDRNKLNCNPDNLRYVSRKTQADNTIKVIRSVEKYGVRPCEDINGYYRTRRAKDPEYAEQQRAYLREWRAKRRAKDPEKYRANKRKYYAKRCAEDPEFAERERIRKREQYAAQKALGKKRRKCPDGKYRLLTDEEYKLYGK